MEAAEEVLMKSHFNETEPPGDIQEDSSCFRGLLLFLGDFVLLQLSFFF